MKPSSFSKQNGLLALAIAAMLFICPAARAFPPAPHHLIYGTVRDEYGTPLMTSAAQIILTTPTGVQLTTQVIANLGYGMNFELEVPMDSGLTADPYEPNALVASAPFKLIVVIGTTTNLPIQMTGNFSQLGQPGQQTRIDLTLGVDANGDGIPDAWELVFLSEIGSSLGLNGINGGSKLTKDGLTTQQQFLAGNYPFDPDEPFVLSLVGVNNDSPVLQFTAITGRYYMLLGSADLKTWTPLSFYIPAEGSSGLSHNYYFAPSIDTVQIQAVQPGGPTLKFFKMVLQ